jgi:hypothetical protein
MEQEAKMPEITRRKRESVERSLAGYIAAGGTDAEGMRAKLQAAHDDESFVVGDEVVCTMGSLTGYVIEVIGPDALIAWNCRGKSMEHLTDLRHIAHED